MVKSLWPYKPWSQAFSHASFDACQKQIPWQLHRSPSLTSSTFPWSYHYYCFFPHPNGNCSEMLALRTKIRVHAETTLHDQVIARHVLVGGSYLNVCRSSWTWKQDELLNFALEGLRSTIIKNTWSIKFRSRIEETLVAANGFKYKQIIWIALIRLVEWLNHGRNKCVEVGCFVAPKIN